MRKFWQNITSNENIVRYALVATLLVFMVMYDRAGRHKQRSLTGPMVIDVKHLDSGNDFITNQEMREKITKKFSSDFTKVPIEKLDVPEIESQLKSLDFIKSTDVYVDANNRLNILVKQREPLFRILSSTGQSMYVDKDGTTMPASNHYSPRVMVAYLDNIITRDTLNIKRPGQEKDLYDLATTISHDNVLEALVEEIIAGDHNEWVIIPKLGPSRIYIGTLQNLEEKLETLKKVYRKILPAEGWEKYYSINLKFKGQVICTKKT